MHPRILPFLLAATIWALSSVAGESQDGEPFGEVQGKDAELKGGIGLLP
jgi:hypothetical protein